MKKIFLVISILFTTTAGAYDFTLYTPTLGNNSIYNLDYTSGTLLTYSDSKSVVATYGIDWNLKGSIDASSANISYIQTVPNDINGLWYKKTFTAGMTGGAAIYVDNSFASSQKLVGAITGDFVENTLSGTGQLIGGTILNEGHINSITGDFIANQLISTNGTALGGALGSFDEAGNAGTAFATIGDVKSNFILNSASAASLAVGGAIFSAGTINSITGDFIANHVQSTTSAALGGAIYIDAGYAWIPVSDLTIKNITGDFIGNYASGIQSGGGAIYNLGIIGKITGDFIGNGIQNGTAVTQIGGAILNDSGATLTIGGGSNFYGNAATLIGGAIAMDSSTVTLDATGGDINFALNTAAGKPNDILISGTGILEIKGSGNVLFDSGLQSDSTDAVIKNSNGTIILGANSVNDGFTGTFNQTSGHTMIYSDNFFAGKNYITNGGTVHVIASNVNIGHLDLSGGAILDLRDGVAPFVQNMVTVDNLLSDGTAKIYLETDGTTSDVLRINGLATGNFLLHIMPAIGATPVNKKIDVVEVTNTGNADAATFKIDTTTGIFELGAWDYALVHEPSGNWYLETDGKLNTTAQSVAGIPAIQLSVVKAGMNELRKRLGALRENNNNDEVTGSWVRGYGKHLKIHESVNATMNLFGFEGGIDFMANAMGGKIYFGIMGGYMGSEDVRVNTTVGKADGYTHTPSAGAYLTWIHKSNSPHKWFADLTARHFWVTTNIEKDDGTNGYDVTRKFWAFSGEIGKLFYMKSPEWLNIGTLQHSHISLEPKIELRYGNGEAMNFMTNAGNAGYVEETHALRAQAGVQANFLPNGTQSIWKYFVEFNVSNDLLGNTDMQFADVDITASHTAGWGMEFSVGSNVTLSDRTYMYGAATIELDEIYTSYMLNLGIRAKF